MWQYFTAFVTLSKSACTEDETICYRCESDGMAVVWNGYETGKKIYKTHPDGLPAQYNAFRQVLSQGAMPI